MYITNLRHAFIGDGAVIDPLNGRLELFKAEMEACAPWQELVLHIGNSHLVGEFPTRIPAVVGQICALWEYEQPHRIPWIVARHRSAMSVVELLQAILDSGLVLCPVASHENEAKELHGRPNDRNPLQRLLQDDEDMAMHSSSVANPPHVEPVSVNLQRI